MRSKEEAFDYRYFPEPDIPPLEPDAAWVEEVRATLPELPRARRERFASDLGLKPDVAAVLVDDRGWAEFFQRTIALGAPAREAANWITQDLAGLLRELGKSLTEAEADGRIEPKDLVDLITGAENLGKTQAKQLLAERLGEIRVEVGEAMESDTSLVAKAIATKGRPQISDPHALGAIVEEVLAEHADVAEQFRAGKEAVIGFLVGQVMKRSGGSANPQLAQELLRERLSG
jgi:aspartyl-tRNA(Asn)/glutamyl-tRNA(Gln) amidotransferase subunit B